MRNLIVIAIALFAGASSAQSLDPLGSPSGRPSAASTFAGGAVTNPIALPVGACPAPSLAITGHTDSGVYYVNEASEEAIGFCIHGVRAGFLGFAPAVSANGQGNTIFGSQAGLALDLSGTGAALNNTFVGGESGNKVTTGQQNTCFGSRSCHELVTNNQVTALGQGAGYSITAGDNIAVGWHSQLNETSGVNTAVGSQSLSGHATGGVGDATANSNTAIGQLTLSAATSASQNVAVGETAGQAVTSATGSVFVGFQTGNHVTSVGSNTIVGSNSFTTATTAGTQNTGVGTNTLQATTGSQNSTLGYASGISIAAGASNTCVGWEACFAGTAVTSGSNNVLIGDSAQVNSAAANNRVAIGQGAIAANDNGVKLGNTSATLLNFGNGHIQHYNAPTSYTAGTCTTTSGTGSEARGTITGTCNNQTAIVTFTTTYATAPFCIVVPVTGAANAAVTTFSYATSTTALTITQTGNIAAETWAYNCSE